MDDSERRPKRSRFDQTESDNRRHSRFDRRSRSPVSRRHDSYRERSPPRQAEPDKSADDRAAAAAAAAARIKEQLEARRGIQHADVPPIRNSSNPDLPNRPPVPAAAPATPSAPEPDQPSLNGEIYVTDGDYMKDIEVNDLRNRYTLTRGPTQKMIKDLTGADVTTRGSYFPDKSMATAANPPLYLHITSTTREGLEKAIAKIEELMQQELPNLVDERRFRRREDNVERDDRGRPKWKEEKINIDLDPLPGFNLRAQVVGHGGQYVKHIQQETGCRVQIKGRGSGFIEHATSMEAEEDMFLHVTGPDPAMVEKGKELCLDLVANVREQYEEFKRRPPPNPRYGGYGGDRRDRDRDDRYRDRDRYDGQHHGNHGRNGSYGHQGGHHGGNNDYAAQQASASPATPTAPSGAAQSMSQADYAAQYAQYYGGQDPYAAYGGYAAYYQMYQAYLASQGQTAGGAALGAPGASASPPPPSDAAPPPPPPSSAPPPPPGPPGASGSYNAVPPPPGL